RLVRGQGQARPRLRLRLPRPVRGPPGRQVMRKLLAAVALLLERLLAAGMGWERQQEERKRQAEIERLRNDPAEWWQDNFGTDGADDSRLPGAAQAKPAAAEAAARDRAD